MSIRELLAKGRSRYLEDDPIHTSVLMPGSERKAIIESYSPMAHLEYKAPVIPAAKCLMNKGQRYGDSSLKHLQYLLSAAFRPPNVPSHELVTSESNNQNLERYCSMLRNLRRLLIHACSSMTQAHNNIALRAVNPALSMKSTSEVNYPLLLDEFQQTLIQQTAARKATTDATANRQQRRRLPDSNSMTSGSNPSNSGPFSNVLEQQQFIRSGPSSQQGGFNNNNSSNNTSANYQHNNSSSNNSRKNASYNTNTK